MEVYPLTEEKLKPRTTKGLAQGHTANKRWSQDPNLGSLTSGFNHWCVYLFQRLNESQATFMVLKIHYRVQEW